MDDIAKALGGGKDALNEYESKRLLASAGVPVCREALARDVEEASKIAAEFGYPVVLKAAGSTLYHKTEVGGIALNLKNGSDVRKEGKRLLTIPGCEAILVQEMIQGNREIVCGLLRDVQFGPCVMFGLGGIFTELLQDVVFRVAPLSDFGCAADDGRHSKPRRFSTPSAARRRQTVERWQRSSSPSGRSALPAPRWKRSTSIP